MRRPSGRIAGAFAVNQANRAWRRHEEKRALCARLHGRLISRGFRRGRDTRGRVCLSGANQLLRRCLLRRWHHRQPLTYALNRTEASDTAVASGYAGAALTAAGFPADTFFGVGRFAGEAAVFFTATFVVAAEDFVTTVFLGAPVFFAASFFLATTRSGRSRPVKNCSLNICSPLTIRWMKTSGRSKRVDAPRRTVGTRCWRTLREQDSAEGGGQC